MKNKTINLTDLMDMKIHDVIKVQHGVQAVRVPGGWIYYSQTTVDSNLVQTFVPEPIQIDYSDRILKQYKKGIEDIVKYEIVLGLVFLSIYFLLK